MWTAIVWPFEIPVFLWPPGMAQVLERHDRRRLRRAARLDVARLRVTTIGLVVTHLVGLRERYYSAVMARPGCCLAILPGSASISSKARRGAHRVAP